MRAKGSFRDGGCFYLMHVASAGTRVHESGCGL